MMICANCDPEQGERNEATRLLWCPTWVDSYEGPLSLCDEHAKMFMPEHNTNASTGSWHWDEEANTAFQSIEAFVRSEDANYQKIVTMLDEGQEIADEIFVVKGKAWLKHRPLKIGKCIILGLGECEGAKRQFPALFGKSVEKG
jgi:hypothetical protein